MASHYISSFLVLFLLSFVVEEMATQIDTKVEFAKMLFSFNPDRNSVADRLSRIRRATFLDRRLRRSPDEEEGAAAGKSRPRPPRPPKTTDSHGCHISCSSHPQHWRRFRGRPAVRNRMMDYDNEVTIIENQVLPFDAAYADDGGSPGGNEGDGQMPDAPGGGDDGTDTGDTAQY